MSTAGLVFENCYDSERLKTRLLARATQFPGDAQMSNVAVPAAPQSRTSNGAAAQADQQGLKKAHQRPGPARLRRRRRGFRGSAFGGDGLGEFFSHLGESPGRFSVGAARRGGRRG